jgi:DNA-binding NtrC family response regulator
MNPEEGGPTILLVDDDPNHSEALAKTLEQAGYRVRTAGDGHEALNLLGQEPVDLVITDLRMPRMHGLDLLRSIQAMSPEVAVIVLTAHGEWTTYLNAMNSGAVDYLNKPARRQDILMTIRKALARKGIRAPNSPPAASEESGDAPA